ncbi:hypothetical protein HMPREF0043_00568 [Actinobaculum sp. oral taxon 183 str. F0552]|nr:hypothetical protein HMPREF0043_00568 [Actinobaculum sp. oral taxon 183 str. F0552]
MDSKTNDWSQWRASPTHLQDSQLFLKRSIYQDFQRTATYIITVESIDRLNTIDDRL